MLVWETHVAYQHPKAAKLGSPISSTVTTYFCTMSLKCLRYERTPLVGTNLSLAFRP